MMSGKMHFQNKLPVRDSAKRKKVVVTGREGAMNQQNLIFVTLAM
jgi:hypothetical protein